MNENITPSDAPQKMRMPSWTVVFLVLNLFFVIVNICGYALIAAQYGADSIRPMAIACTTLDAAISAYLVAAFARRQKDAVFIARCYTGFGLISCAISLARTIIIGLNCETLPATFFINLGSQLFSLAIYACFLTYFHRSKKVNLFVPKEQRKPSVVAWVVALVLLARLVVHFF